MKKAFILLTFLFVGIESFEQVTDTTIVERIGHSRKAIVKTIITIYPGNWVYSDGKPPADAARLNIGRSLEFKVEGSTVAPIGKLSVKTGRKVKRSWYKYAVIRYERRETIVKVRENGKMIKKDTFVTKKVWDEYQDFRLESKDKTKPVTVTLIQKVKVKKEWAKDSLIPIKGQVVYQFNNTDKPTTTNRPITKDFTVMLSLLPKVKDSSVVVQQTTTALQ